MTELHKERNSDKIALAQKPYTIARLAKIYGVSRPTIYIWLKPFRKMLGENIGTYFNTEQVKIIFEQLGLPLGEKIKRAERKSRAKRYGTAQSAGTYSKQIEISNPRF
jgi:transposase-like protein